MKRLKAILLVLGTLPWADPNAQQSTTFRVAATVVDFCDVTTRDLAPGHSTALLRTTCTPNTTYNVGLNKGGSRSVISGTTPGTETVTGVGTGRAVDHTLFGGVPAAQVVPAGKFADTVTVHVYY